MSSVKSTELKLTAPQKVIVDRLRNGWQIGKNQDFGGRIWMQNGGVGKGGESCTISSTTFNRLFMAGLLVESADSKSYPVKKYELAAEKNTG